MFTPFFSVDLAGIEPASESLSLAASPITVAVLTFPPQHAHRQAYCFSSFMIHLPGQSLPGKVSHKVDARLLKCECNRTDRQRLYLEFPVITQFGRLRMASTTSKPPSKPVQALIVYNRYCWCADEVCVIVLSLDFHYMHFVQSCQDGY